MYNPKRGTNLSIRFLWCYGDREAFCKKNNSVTVSKDERGENRWRIRVYAGRDPGTGKKQYLIETVSRLSMLDAGTLRNGLDSFKPR
jgi:hypothetical protein